MYEEGFVEEQRGADRSLGLVLPFADTLWCGAFVVGDVALEGWNGAEEEVGVVEEVICGNVLEGEM